MKASQFIKLLVLFFYTVACANRNSQQTVNDTNDIDTTILTNSFSPDTFETGKIITHVVCKADASQSYALYIPVKGKDETLPVVYFFDPHGDGSLPLVKYKSLADIYNFIFIGSNNSRNGNDFSTSENVWNTLFDDTQKRLKLNTNRVYVCGFSGGAKVATSVALNHNQIKGVIANGAGLPELTSAGNFNFSFTAIAGEGDLNMTDLVAITNDLDKTQTRHRIIYFNGIHEWAPENTMNIAFAGLEFDAMQKRLIPVNNEFINSYVVGSKKRIADYTKAKNYIRAIDECKLSISMLEALTNEVNWFKEKAASVENNPVYKKQWQNKQELLVEEQNIKNEYEQQFQNGDINYWIKTIDEVKTKAKDQGPQGAMYQRLQAYLSLAFYSITNQLIKQNQNNNAQYFDNFYKKVDSLNTEAWYLSAIINARDNNSKATQDDLVEAISLGFGDKNRIEQQPEFQQLRSQINLTQIESKIK